MRIRTISLLCVIACLFVTLAIAQSGNRQLYGQNTGTQNPSTAGYRLQGWRYRTIPSGGEYPTWEIEPEFKDDVFTFVRIQYDSYGSNRVGGHWDNDYPDSDLNFSFRLQQLTSLNVHPDGKVLRLTDPELCNYPFIYMVGVQRMTLSPPEQEALRRYLLNGGFVMLDDFWSSEGWASVITAMRGVFPDREPVELSLDHEIFHIVYDFKEFPQVCDIQSWSDGYMFEYRHGDPGWDEYPHFWAYFDDHGRMVALICHNNDLGDGWEREAQNEDYFHQFSETQSYPMGINIIFYAMSH